MDKTYKILKGQITKADDGKITIIASDATQDRQGESIPVESWDLSNYLKSPRLLVDHDYSVKSIVGIAEAVRVEDGKLLFSPIFHDITQMAQETAEMVKQGFLDTVSVGFLRKSQGEKTLNELMEISFVAVPANPSARVLSYKALEPKEEQAVMEFVKEHEQVEQPIEPTPPVEPDVVPNEPEAIPDEVKGEKEGRVLSTKNRELVKTVIESMKSTVEALSALLEATEPQKSSLMPVGENGGRDTKKEGETMEITPELLKELRRTSLKSYQINEIFLSITKKVSPK